MVDWAFAPKWLTLEQACWLSGDDQATMAEIIEAGGVDLNDAGLIEKESLWDFLEVAVLVAHWYD